MKYKALMEGNKEVTWLRSLIGELGFLQLIPTPISCDMSIMKITNNIVFYARTKHIECHCHFVHEKMLSHKVELIHVPINDQLVDIFTRALRRNKFEEMSGENY
jgi:hypothetical protein